MREERLEKGAGRPGKDDERRRGKSSDKTECAEAADEGLQLKAFSSIHL